MVLVQLVSNNSTRQAPKLTTKMIFLDEKGQFPPLKSINSWIEFKEMLEEASGVDHIPSMLRSNMIDRGEHVIFSLEPASKLHLPFGHGGRRKTDDGTDDVLARLISLINRDGGSVKSLVLEGISYRGMKIALCLMQSNTSATRLSILRSEVVETGSQSLKNSFLSLLLNKPRLEHLDFGGTRLPPACLQHIFRGAMRHPNLKSLVLDHSSFDEDSIRNLETLLLRNRNITSLSVSHCVEHCPYTFALSIARVLLRNTTLTKLNISGNQLDSIGLYYIRKVLATENHTLQEIQFSDNSRNAKGVVHILRHNTYLRRIKVHLTCKEKHLLEICDALSFHNTTLRHVELIPRSNTRLTDKVAHGLAQTLVSNQTLESLQLKFKGKPSQAAKTLILECLRQNHSLTSFEIGWLGLEEKYQIAVGYCMDRNRINRFLAKRMEMYGLEKASSASLSALYYYLCDTCDSLKEKQKE